MVIKYRRAVIDDTVSERLKEIFDYISPRYNITVQEWNHDKALTKSINAYKSASTRLIKREYPQITEKLWNGFFWARSLCLMTTGGAPIEIIRKYIESQRYILPAEYKKRI